MQEYIIPFLPGTFPNESFFRVEMTGITYPDARYHIERKHSNVMCLEYILSGKGELIVNNKQYHAGPGDVYLLAPGTDHAYRSDSREPWEKIWMNVQGSLCETLLRGYGLEEQVVFHDCPLLPYFERFLDICKNAGSDLQRTAASASLLLHELLQELTGYLDCAANARPADAAWSMKEYIDSHISDKLTLPELAHRVNLSASQAGRLFRRAYRLTPYEYILERKIDTAQMLLKNTGLSVKEIAYRLSFADEHYFCNVFRRRTGKTPGEYRALK